MTSYVVEVLEKDTETWKQIATTVETTTTYEIPEELPEQPVVFRVIAANVVGISPPSQEIVVTVQTGGKNISHSFARKFFFRHLELDG